MLGRAFLILFALIHDFACVEWDTSNDPSTVDSLLTWKTFEYRLKLLPQQAQIIRAPWSDDYWPSYLGGIARRWQTEGNGQNFFETYQLYSRQELYLMTTEQLQILSPAEKYDIYNMDYNYTTVKSERGRVSPYDQYWEGLCHGWSPAAIQYAEPRSVTMTNRDGIAIPFASSDIKALLTYFLGVYTTYYDEYWFIGKRCNYGLTMQPSPQNRNPACWDVNPGTFHLLVTNLLGNGSTFNADVVQEYEVWNQPLVGYRYAIAGTYEPNYHSAPGTVKTVLINFELDYTVELAPSREAHGEPAVVSRQHQYYLDLNSRGEIIGGSYAGNEPTLPDFLWNFKAPAFSGNFLRLADIYARATSWNPTSTRLIGRSLTVDDMKPVVAQGDTVTFASKDVKEPRAWLIESRSSTEPLRLKLTSLTTGSQPAFVRIYQSKDGNLGALVMIAGGSSPQLQGEVVIGAGFDAVITFAAVPMAASGLGTGMRTTAGFTLSIV